MKFTHSPNFPFSVSLISLFLILSLIQPFSRCYISTGHEVRDLYRTNSCFSVDTDSWGSSSASSPMYTTCDGQYLLGGYDVLGAGSSQYDHYFAVTYMDLKPHTWVYYSFRLWAMNSWNEFIDYFIIELDTKSFPGWQNFDYQNNFRNEFNCGNNLGGVRDIRIYGRVAHTASTLTFKLLSKLDQSSANEAFGIRDLTLNFGSPAVAPTETMCGIASIPIEAPKQCDCAPGTYPSGGGCAACDPLCVSCFGPSQSECYACVPNYSFDGTSSCIQCHSTCATCFGLSNTQCSSCQSGYILFETTCIPIADCPSPLLKTKCNTYCENPCTDANDFLYWDGTCSHICVFPLHQGLWLGSIKVCQYPCAAGETLYWDGTCESSCSTYLVPRVDRGKNYCDYPCDSTQYLYWNGTCGSDCPRPLNKTTKGGAQFCNYQCTGTQYLYWNGSCSSSCVLPLVQRIQAGKRYCDFPCAAGYVLYWDGTCAASCKRPYIKIVQGGYAFCEPPCSVSDFTFWDGSCSSTCESHYLQSISGGRKFCNSPCSANEFLYWNGSCLSSCSAPLQVVMRGLLRSCEYPCTNAGDILNWNGSCISTSSCRLPYSIKHESGKVFCRSICPDSYELFWNGSCISSSCEAPLRYSSNSSGTFCNRPCNSSSEFYYVETGECSTECKTTAVLEGGLYWRCIVPETIPDGYELMKLLHHIRYLKIKFPPKLQYMKVNRRMNVISMRVIPSHFKVIKEAVLENTILSKVDKYILPSSFIANFLDDLMLMAIILGIGIFFDILERIFKAKEWFCMAYFFERVKVLTKWNLFIVLVVTNAGDIIFFLFVEIKDFDPSTVTTHISLTVSLIILSAVVLVLIGTLVLISKIQEFKEKVMNGTATVSYYDYLLNFQDFQILFGNLKDQHLLPQSFYFVYTLRLAFPMMVAAFLSSVPLLQAIFYVLISLAIIGFLLCERPIRKLVDLINLITLETIILVANISVLGLTIFDVWKMETNDTHTFFGDVIIVMNTCIDFLGLVFLPIKVLDGIYYASSLRKINSKEEAAAWIQLLFLPIQQGGLGFEKVQLVTPYQEPVKKKPSNIRRKIAAIPRPKEQISISVSKCASLESNISTKSSRPSIMNPEMRLDSLKIPELEQMSQFKKRKSGTPSPQSEASLTIIPEVPDNDEALVTRLKNLSDLPPPEASRNDIDQRRRDFYQGSQSFFSEVSLDLTRASSFNLHNTTTCELVRRSPRNNGNGEMFS